MEVVFNTWFNFQIRMKKVFLLVTFVLSYCLAYGQTISFSGSSRSVAEGAGVTSITLTIANPTANPSSVQVVISSGSASDGADYSFANPTTVTFPGSSTAPQTVSLTLNEDAAPEADEFLVLRLQNPTNAQIGSANSYLLLIQDNDKTVPSLSQCLSLSLLTSYRNPNGGSSEIVAYEKTSKRLFIANSVANKLDIVNFANPSAPVSYSSISVSALGGSINSVVVQNGVIAAAIENTNKVLPGKVVFFDANGTVLKEVTTGVLPDMVAISPDGKYVVTANEGEPDSYLAGGTDPEGSVTIIDISGGIANLTQANVTTVSFAPLNGLRDTYRAQGIRIFGRKGNVANGSSVAEDFEPEYVAFTPDSKLAYVTLQENNALIVIDLDTKTIATKEGQPFVKALGYKNHNVDGNSFDPSDQGGVISFQKLPVLGVYMPDAIASYQVNGQTYFITANEGDAREWDGLVEVLRAGANGYTLDPTAFPNATDLKNNQLLGRLNVTNQSGDTDGDGDFDQIHVLGGRSISIWDANGNQVWDSGDQLERITRNLVPGLFNASNTTGAPAIKNRSDDKGPEPEGVTTAQIGDKLYAFVGLERIGGVMVYDVTNPVSPQFVTYTNNRSVAGNAATDDLGPEGIIYISAADSPNGQPLVLIANEISSSVSVFQLNTNGAGCTPPAGGTLALTEPLYNCNTRQITFQTTGGDGSPVEFRAIGVRDWSTNPVATIEAPVVADPNNSTILMEARQHGVVVTRVFNFRTYNCNGPVTPPSSLSLLAPIFSCATRQITFQTTGGNGSPIEFRAVGVRDWSTNPVAFIEAPVIADPNNSTILMEARQNGVVVTRVFNFRVFCPVARVAIGAESDLRVTILGNPTQQDVIEVDVRGAENQALHLQVTDGQGRLLSEQSVDRASAIERQRIKIGQSAGMYILLISTADKVKAVKLVRQ